VSIALRAFGVAVVLWKKKIKPKAQKNKSLRDKLNWIANLIASVVYISFILHNCPFVLSFTKLNNG
jgi:hypothetical protein